MLKLLKKPQHQSFAEKAAKETAPANGVGKFLGTSTEDKESTNYRFESKLTGYVGWEWNVVVFQAKKSDAATPLSAASSVNVDFLPRVILFVILETFLLEGSVLMLMLATNLSARVSFTPFSLIKCLAN